MARPKVENPNKPVSISFSKTTLDLLDEYSKETGIIRSTIVCEAIELLLRNKNFDNDRKQFDISCLKELVDYFDYLGSDWLDAVEAGKEEHKWPDRAKGANILDQIILPNCAPHIPSVWERVVPIDVINWIDYHLYPLESGFSCMQFFEIEGMIRIVNERLKYIIGRSEVKL